MKKVLIILLFILSLIIFYQPAFAQDKVNKYGIHILITDEIYQAAKLVNTSGGDWGWVTIVIRDDQMEKKVIQKFFDDCRELHLIPLIRITTHQEKNYWVAPTNDDADKWANFLGDLNWPVKDRYLVIFNEPNQAKEWGGMINPAEYAQILDSFISIFKPLNPDFKILNAGFDLAASNTKTTMDAFKFWQGMEQAVPGIFNKLDGWASHSYPNHGYIGTPYQTGRTSIQGYRWELQILKKNFQIDKDLPVFITETGWPVKKLKIKNQKSKFLDDKTATNYLQTAYQDIWLKDETVVAVTPFVLNYPEAPFAEFSWLDKDGSPSAQFQMVQSLTKVSWWPEQELKYELKNILLPPFLPTNSTFSGKLTLKNIGQSIWGEQKKLNLSGLEIVTDKKIKPGETAEFKFNLFSGATFGQQSFFLADITEFKIWVVPSSIITKVEYNLWQKLFTHLWLLFHKAE